MTSKTSKSNSSSVSDIKDNETYQSMEHKEHILNVPDTYIGSVEPTSIEDVWVCNSDDVFVQKDIEISPGLYNIFNEILTNSSDQCLRTREYAKKDKTVQITTVIKITIDEETGIISVLNDGDGIPVVEHPEKKIMIPELIFGQLLTSSNYDKTKKKTWGGKNGYGSKVCNIYSTMFEVETVDHRRGKKFKQVWRNNMSEPEKKAKVTDCKGKAYTKITFLPEYSRFGMPDGLKGDVIDIIRKRAYDIAGCSPRDVGVYFNGNKLQVKDFSEYVEKYIGKQKDVKRVYEKPNEFWEIVACASPDGNHRQVSLVNGICTINGGKHVDYITNKICKDLVAKVNGKAKTGGIKPNHVKNNLWVFINSLIVNPSFSSQTKEALTTPVANFGSKCELSDDFIKKLAKTEIADRAKLMKSFHDKSGLSKTDGKKTKSIRGIPKLDDANWAGTAKSHECTLILTEGDSAKALVISGLSVVGRDKYGVFPLRGKLLNVREASDKQITGNAEIQNIKKILGLQQGTKSIKDLRYGKVLILTDQDKDGLHIKGLLMNMFACYWEPLLEEGFLITMYTPIVKVRKGNKVVKVFYNQNDYELWKDSSSLKGLTIKYYKGLGTSSKDEAKEYFKSLNTVDYDWCDDSKGALDLAFNKKKANKRKRWLSFYDQNNVINPLDKKVTYKNFVDKELIHFSNYDNERSIPSFCDGNKTSQRKVLFVFFKKNLIKEVKVAQAASYVSAESAYHHGEVSLEGTIVGLAQTYVGSNNINLLFPSGMLGTRLQGGKDCAQSRYIFTNLEKITKLIYRKEDEPLLNFLVEEGDSIEPSWYLPVLPMILVNGGHGIGTGFSTHVPCFNPKDIISNLKLMLEDKKIKTMAPWYRHFKGNVVQKKFKGVKKWYTEAKYSFKSPTVLEITELPIGVWTDDYHKHLEDLLIDKSDKDAKNKKKQYLIDYKKCNNHDDENVHLLLTFKKEVLSDLKEDPKKLKKILKLEESKSCSVSNLHLYDPLGEIVKFNSPEAILRSYYRIRLPFYKKRKDFSIKFLEREIRYLLAKIRFVKGIIEETVHISKRPNDEILVELRDTHGFPPDPSQDELVISPISKEVYTKALEGEVKRYSYDIDNSDSEESDSSDDESESDDEESDNESVILSEAGDAIRGNASNDIAPYGSDASVGDPEHPNGQSPYSTDDDKSVHSLELKDEVKIEETRDVKKILSEDYGYLLTMHIWSLTQEKLNELELSCNKKNQELDYMKKVSPKEMWKNDLIELEKEL
jgi:DNA topoisomerase-2